MYLNVCPCIKYVFLKSIHAQERTKDNSILMSLWTYTRFSYTRSKCILSLYKSLYWWNQSSCCNCDLYYLNRGFKHVMGGYDVNTIYFLKVFVCLMCVNVLSGHVCMCTICAWYWKTRRSILCSGNYTYEWLWAITLVLGSKPGVSVTAASALKC